MSAPDPTPAPSAIAGYRIDRILAVGGMGTVYLAQSPTLPRREALKVLHAALSPDPDRRARFLAEADITASLHHRNIVSVFNRGETLDGQLWIAMEYVEGTDAETAVRAGPLTPGRALHIVTEVARALDFAHHRGVVHQDIKPSNFLLGDLPDEPERVVLSDFGAALSTQDTDPSVGPLAASLAYAAPEVIKGAAVDGRADIYALGCTFFRLLTGLYPFPGHDDVAAMVTAHLDQPAPRLTEYLPWANHQLDRVLATALAKDPAQRYATAGEFARAAAAALRDADTAPRPVRPAPPTPPMPPPPPTAPTTTAHTSSAPVDFINHLPVAQPVTSKRHLAIGAAIAATLLVAGLVVWLALPTSTPTTGDASNPAPAPTDGTQDALRKLLPAGYPPGTCNAAGVNTELATAALTCGPNTDPGGPPRSSFTLARNPSALQALFAQDIATTSIVVCPGNIQSPGPWRKLATPDVVQGTVVCGLRDGHPLVAWTTTNKRLTATIESDNPSGATLEQLYAWWSSHS